MQVLQTQQEELLSIRLNITNYKKKLEAEFNQHKKVDKNNLLKIFNVLEDIDNKISKIINLYNQRYNLATIHKERLECVRDIVILSEYVNNIKLKQTITLSKKLITVLLNLAREKDEDAIVTIPNVSFSQYKSITKIIGEASWCKISYLDGLLEIMSPGLNHEKVKEGFSLIIQLYCIKNNINCFAFGSSDLKNQAKGEGKKFRKQPDAGFCFVNQKGKPDIAIEVNFSSGSIDDLKIYEGIEIPEVWMYDRKNKTKFYALVDQKYQEITKSQYLKDLTPTFLDEIIDVAITGSINEIAHRLDNLMDSQ